MAVSATIDPGSLVVLPEMYDSGFSLNVDITQDEAGQSAEFVSQLARDLGVTVQAGLTRVGPDGMGRNRAIVCDPSGAKIASYDKIHPFSYGREGERFAGGDRVETFTWESGGEELRVCPVICYDLRFPELFRRGLGAGAEVFAIGANWPLARAGHWRALSIARAIENQAFVLGVNRCGEDPHLAYGGGTIAVSPTGEVLGELGEAPGVLSSEVDAAAVRAWRREFPAWRDGKEWLGGPVLGDQGPESE